MNAIDRKSTRLNSSHSAKSRMPSSEELIAEDAFAVTTKLDGHIGIDEEPFKEMCIRDSLPHALPAGAFRGEFFFRLFGCVRLQRQIAQIARRGVDVDDVGCKGGQRAVGVERQFFVEQGVEMCIRDRNYILEGVYFYSGFMFFYNLSRNGKMPGSAQA